MKTLPYNLLKEYRKYLKSDTWKKLSKSARKRDGHRCVRCGFIGPLEVHHTDYIGCETMEFTLDQLESVCNMCHTDIHEGKLPIKKE